MSSDVKDGGPAFPSGKIDCGSCWEDFPYLGLSVRDYFAAQALDGLIRMYAQGDPKRCAEEIAPYAYLFADAMLRAREAK